MLQKSLLCLVAFAMILLSATMVPTANFHHSQAAVMSGHFGAGSVTIDVDHPPNHIDMGVGATITCQRYGGAAGGSVSISSYNSDGQVGPVLSDLPGGPIGTVHTFRADRAGVAQIVIRYTPKGGFAQSAQVTVTVR